MPEAERQIAPDVSSVGVSVCSWWAGWHFGGRLEKHKHSPFTAGFSYNLYVKHSRSSKSYDTHQWVILNPVHAPCTWTQAGYFSDHQNICNLFLCPTKLHKFEPKHDLCSTLTLPTNPSGFFKCPKMYLHIYSLFAQNFIKYFCLFDSEF